MARSEEGVARPEVLDEELSSVHAQFAGVLLSHETVTTLIKMITLLARDLIPGATGAGLTLVDSQGK